jgi:hypothetical protein
LFQAGAEEKHEVVVREFRRLEEEVIAWGQDPAG